MSDQVQSGGGTTSSGGNYAKKFFAEAIGTACLTYFACGTLVVTSGYNFYVTASAIAFGFVIVAMFYSIGNVSGCHRNPAVSLCMLIRKKLPLCEFGIYIGAQFLGGLVGSAILGLCLRGEFEVLGGNFIQNPLKQNNSPNAKLDGWSYVDALVIEIILTFIFVLAFQGAIDNRYHDGKHSGIVIGLALALVYFFGINLTGTSVNPARSLGPALIECFAGKYEAIEQIWIFFIGPFAGGALSGLAYGALSA